MSFQPQADQEFIIDGVTYSVAEHPAASGMPYGQEGRAAIVYQLAATDDQKRALKVFKPRYRSPGLVTLADRLISFASLPGLRVCRRNVLAPQHHAALLRQHPDLTYAVLMPWVEGPTWMEVMLEKRAFTPAESLSLARCLTEVLVAMEQRNLAHCDLSASNAMLPLLAGGTGVSLVDVEGMHGPELQRPREILSGSPGYAHRTAPEGVWSIEADRFAGAVLIAEMLGWCDERVREAAWGENYFDPGEVQQDGGRYRVLVDVLQERWDSGVTGLLERAWRSETLTDCATFGEWLVILPERVSAAEIAWPAVAEGIQAKQPRVANDTLTTLRSLGRRFVEQGNLAGALEVYRQAQVLAPVGSELAEELAYTVESLESQRAGIAIVGAQPREKAPGEVEPVAAESLPAPGAVAQAEAVETKPVSPALRSAAEEAQAHVVAPANEPPQEQPGIETPFSSLLVHEGLDPERLFADGLAAYERGDWARAKELLGEVMRREPTHVRAKAMLANVEKQLALPRRRRVLARMVGVLGGLVILIVLLLGGGLLTLLSGGLSPSAVIESPNTPLPPTSTAALPVLTGTSVPPSAVIEPTNTPLSLIPTVALPVLAGTSVPPSSSAISPQNASQVKQLARWGKGGVEQVAYSADGQFLAVSSSLGIYLYDAEILAEVRFIETFAWVESVAFSPDGTTLASGARDGTVRLWRVTDGSLLRTLEGHTMGVRSVVFSPDGTTLASGARDNMVRLWRVADGSLLRALEGHTSEVWSVAFSPDGTMLASGAHDNTVRLWRVADGSLLRTLEGYTAFGVGSVVFSPDGTTLASGARDNMVRLWRVADGSLLRTLEGHTSEVWSVAFSPDGTMLASGAHDNTVRLWRVADGSLLRTLEGHTSDVESVAFSPDGTTLASGAWDGTVRLWQLADGSLLRMLKGHTYGVEIESVAFSPDGTTLASGAWDGMVRLWRASDGTLLDTLEEHTWAIQSVAFSPDGTMLASGAYDNMVRLWRVADGSLLCSLERHTMGVRSVAFGPDGATLASGSLDGTVQLWRVADGSLLCTLEEHTGFGVGSVAFSPDGTILASGAWDNMVRLWRVADGSLLRTLEGHTSEVWSVAFSPDGATLASGAWDGTVRLWRVADGSLLHALEEHTGHVESVAFSPDGATLASGAWDGTVRLWRVADGSLLRTLEEHTGPVESVAFSPDGTTLASGALDGTVRLWGVQQ